MLPTGEIKSSSSLRIYTGMGIGGLINISGTNIENVFSIYSAKAALVY
jgi:hypothetical protein